MTHPPLSSDSALLRPLRLGAIEVPNRILMAPLTRNRAEQDGTPNQLQATYYAQRAGAGLIISEGSQPAAIGKGYPGVPGVHTDTQQAGWGRIADAVHEQGGRMVVQLMHGGRISHPDTLGGDTPVAPSAIRPEGEIVTPTGTREFVEPRELATDELPGVIAEFAEAARRAVAAGLDGVELHAANGYLLHQFLADGTNRRTDGYGGSAEARARFVVEVAGACAEAIGADRVGIRLSPGHPFNDVSESDLDAYPILAGELRELGLAYVHLLVEPDAKILARLREIWPDRLVLNTGCGLESDRDELAGLIEGGVADAVAVGRHFIANPDLVRRWSEGTELNEPDPATFYGGDGHGYTDYPTLDQVGAGS
ncbi:MAG TPA: alkene reductase [Pseudonocardia sp.]|jgi:N-ethylmaleimide reductase